jgi:hypothetical protein
MPEKHWQGLQLNAGLELMRRVTVSQGILVLLMICTRGRFVIAITRDMG